MINQVEILPDAGSHEDPNCWRWHLDCRMVMLHRILSGKSEE